MGSKKIDTRPLWQSPEAAVDAQKILASCDKSRLKTTTYGEMMHKTGLPLERVQLAIRNIAQTTNLVPDCAPKPYPLTGYPLRRELPVSEAKIQAVSIEELPVEMRTFPLIHHWPDGLPLDHKTARHGNSWLWCGIPIGTMFQSNPSDLFCYRWTEDPEKVSCKICLRKLSRLADKTMVYKIGITEIL